jgi:hypothetical protein
MNTRSDFVSRRCLTFLALAASVAGAAPAVRANDAVTDAIDRGTEFLLKEVEAKQIPDQHKAGQVALETYALIVAGVAVEHPLIQKNIELLQKTQLNHTYTVSCIAFAMDAAMSQVEADQHFISGREFRGGVRSDKKYTTLLEKCIKSLVGMRQPKIGAWNYGAGGNRYDNSNTQFAVLALGVGAKRKIPIPDELWEAIAKHFIDGQNENGPEVKERIELLPKDEKGDDKRNRVKVVDKDDEEKRSGAKEKDKDKAEKEGEGKTVVVKPVPEFGDEKIEVFSRGWVYVREEAKNGATWNMTCAGLSSQILAAEQLKGKVSAEFLNKLNISIRDGYGWVMANWSPTSGGYYGIYSVEKVGDLGEVKKFGAHDWYQEISEHLVKEQRANGSWPGGNPEDVRVNTSFALLVLNRASSLLTRRANKIVITGPGAHKGAEDRDNWVYVQSMDREFHVPSLFRMLRLRPSPQLAKFVTLVVENHPPETNARLVPLLAASQEKVTDPRFKRFLGEKLLELTGIEYDSPAKYRDWYRDWQLADDIGDKADKARVGEILKLYEKPDLSPPLKAKVIWALGRCQSTAATERLIADLTHDDVVVRESAYGALTSLPYGKEPLPPFNPKGENKKREKQVVEIQEWYKRTKA